MMAGAPPLTPGELREQFQCGQCMQLAFAEVARLVEAAGDDLTRDGAVAIIRDWAETRRKQDARQMREGRGSK